MADSYTRNGIAIINPYGHVWTDRIFQKPEEAVEYLRSFWKEMPMDISKFKLAMATLTITIDRPAGEPTFIDLNLRS